MSAPDHPISDRAAYLALVLPIITISIVGIGLSLSIPLISFAMEARGASDTLIGLNLAMGGVATILVAPLAPRMAGRLGVGRLIAGATVAGALALIAFPFVAELWLWFPLRFLYGGALAVLFVLSEFWIASVARPHQRGFIIGIYGTVLALGFASGPAILAVVGADGILPFAVGAALFLAAGLPVAAFSHLAPSLAHKGPRVRGGIVAALRHSPAATLAAFLFGGIETGAMSFLGLYGTRSGYDMTFAALLVSAVALGNVVSQVPLGFLSDRLDRRKMLLMIALVGASGAFLFPVVSPYPVGFFTLVTIWGGFIAGLYTVGLSHLAARYSGNALADANAAFVMLYSLGLIVGPVMLGAAMDVLNPQGFPLAMGALFIAYALIVGLRLHNRG